MAALWQEIHQLQMSTDQTALRKAMEQMYAELQQMRTVQSAMLGQTPPGASPQPEQVPVYDLTMEEEFELEGWSEEDAEGEEI